MGDYSIERIASVTAPTLVIDGEMSDVRLRHAVQAVADALPNAQRRTLAGQTHDVSPEALAPVLEEFFNKTLYRFVYIHGIFLFTPCFMPQDVHIEPSMAIIARMTTRITAIF
jgi:hypothetical protein